MQEELKLEFPFTHLTGSHSPTSTMVVFVPLRTQPAGRVSFFDQGVEEHESSDFSGEQKKEIAFFHEYKVDSFANVNLLIRNNNNYDKLIFLEKASIQSPRVVFRRVL